MTTGVGVYDDSTDDALKKKKLSKVSKNKSTPYEVDEDFTMSRFGKDGRKKLQLGDGNESEQKEKLSEVEIQAKKAEAAQRRKMQLEKAEKEQQAEAMRKILGIDSEKKKEEKKLKEREEKRVWGFQAYLTPSLSAWHATGLSRDIQSRRVELAKEVLLREVRRPREMLLPRKAMRPREVPLLREVMRPREVPLLREVTQPREVLGTREVSLPREVLGSKHDEPSSLT
nr:unnamed protein product [Digitaria exilis]